MERYSSFDRVESKQMNRKQASRPTDGNYQGEASIHTYISLLFQDAGRSGETDDEGRCLHFLFGRCLTLLLLMQIWMDDHRVRHQKVKCGGAHHRIARLYEWGWHGLVVYTAFSFTNQASKPY